MHTQHDAGLVSVALFLAFGTWSRRSRSAAERSYGSSDREPSSRRVLPATLPCGARTSLCSTGSGGCSGCLASFAVHSTARRVDGSPWRHLKSQAFSCGSDRFKVGIGSRHLTPVRRRVPCSCGVGSTSY